ncbi:MOSC domain containing protein [Emticicia oligotrophica DSM 17448]|uniref:MOSC domain containing protein n=1 Tax=Emticicia oligotrophica (strain DSM 17448 / CIP 109782 / MTCC 6937 / GPTSA100-15) TaxID=929562 RepID=A0ABM5N4I3_EMTOG|nr:MOSC domain-containing protein [Emticicia oligotrophica]AFK04362.1 MOSC domain containing protein [Emticicia oligotrophica DSM 17448]
MEINELMQTFPHDGKVEWLSFRPGPTSRGEIVVVDEISVSEKQGIEGDRYRGSNKKRQVTIIQAEHIEAVSKILKKENIDPSLLRRNIVVSGLNLLALNNLEFKIGDAILKMTGYCHPCSRMEQNLGTGGYNAMRGHGGITCMVIKSGKIKIGDAVSLIKN